MSAKKSNADFGRPYCHVRNRGAPFERDWNKGHALTAPGTHRAQSWGDPMATSFQCLQTRRKLNVPGTKRVL